MKSNKTCSIWTAKFTVAEFLKRLSNSFWKKSFELQLRAIRIFLGATFVAVFVSTLAECQPFNHYWQVRPDPGPQCRQGYAQLITMGVSDIITDIVLIIFPIPIVLKSAMTIRRKLDLIILFSLSGILIAITAYRVPAVIQHHGRQQYRTVWASSEILAAAAVSNAIVLGSFLRDRGIKKSKYKFGSTTDSMDRTSSRRHTLTKQVWGSDEDLIRDMCYRLDPEFESCFDTVPRPAQVADPAGRQHEWPAEKRRLSQADIDGRWNFPEAAMKADSARSSSSSDSKTVIDYADSCPSPRDSRSVQPPAQQQKRSVSFFDVGGLLEEGENPLSHSVTLPIRRDSQGQRRASSQAHTRSRTRSRDSLPDTINVRDHAITSHHDTTSPSPPPPTPARRGSLAFLSDLPNRILLPTPLRARTLRASETADDTMSPQSPAPTSSTPRHTRSTQSRSRSRSRARELARHLRENESPPPPTGVQAPRVERGRGVMELQDVGGLVVPADVAESAVVEDSPGPVVQSPAAEPENSDLGRSLTRESSQPPQRPAFSPWQARAQAAAAARSPSDMSLGDVGGLLR